jgi:hypothetical protein
MTPNQAEAIPLALAAQLDSGPKQMLRPTVGLVDVRERADGTGSYDVRTHWVDLEGYEVELCATVAQDGATQVRPARWTIGEPLREDGPGVRDGFYSASWL